MIGIRLQDGFLDMANTAFHCPHCEKPYSDNNDYYRKKCFNNKKGFTTIKCECKNKFGMTYSMWGDAVAFILNPDEPTIVTLK